MTESVASTTIRKVATEKAILLEETATGVTPTQVGNLVDGDIDCSSDRSEGNNDRPRLPNPKSIEIPFPPYNEYTKLPLLLEEAVKDKLESNPELFRENHTVEHLVVGVWLSWVVKPYLHSVNVMLA